MGSGPDAGPNDDAVPLLREPRCRGAGHSQRRVDWRLCGGLSHGRDAEPRRRGTRQHDACSACRYARHGGQRSDGRKNRGQPAVRFNNRVTAASFAVGSTFTYEAWVQPESASNRWRCILNNDPLYNRWFGLRDNDIDFWDNSSERIVGANVVPGASWYHVAVTYDGTQLRGYNNGTAGTPLMVALPSAPSAPLQIGYTVALTTEWFQGRIDEVRVSSVWRSDAYVSTSYNNQSSPSTFATLEAERAVAIAECYPAA